MMSRKNSKLLSINIINIEISLSNSRYSLRSNDYHSSSLYIWINAIFFVCAICYL